MPIEEHGAPTNRVLYREREIPHKTLVECLLALAKDLREVKDESSEGTALFIAASSTAEGDV